MAFWYLLNVPGQCQHGGIEPSLPILFLNKLFSHSNTQAPWFYPSNLSKKWCSSQNSTLGWAGNGSLPPPAKICCALCTEQCLLWSPQAHIQDLVPLESLACTAGLGVRAVWVYLSRVCLNICPIYTYIYIYKYQYIHTLKQGWGETRNLSAQTHQW